MRVPVSNAESDNEFTSAMSSASPFVAQGSEPARTTPAREYTPAVIQKIDEPQEVAPAIQPPPVVQEEIYDIADAERRYREHRQLQTMQMLDYFVPRNADKTAESIELANRYNLDLSYVEENQEELSHKLRMDKLRSALVQSPVLADFYADPKFAAVAHDDAENLSIAEKIITTFKSAPEDIAQGYLSGRTQVDIGRVRNLQQFQGGKLTKDQQRYLNELKAKDAQYGEAGGVFKETARIIGQMSKTIPNANETGLATGLAFGGLGMTVTAPLGGSGSVLTFPAGYVAGFRTQMALDSYRFESGLAYDEFLEAGIDPDAANSAAHVVGVINGSLEVIGFKILAGPLLPVAKKLLTAGAKKALIKRTKKQAAKALTKNYAKILTGEVSVELTQELTNIAVGDITRVLTDDVARFETPEGRDSIVDQISEIFWQSTKGMSILSMLPAGGRFAYDIYQANKAIQQTEFLSSLMQNTEASKLNQRSKNVYQEFIGRQVKDSKADTVYIDAGSFQTALESSGLSRADIAKISPDIAEQIDTVQTDGDIVIPTEVFVTHFSGTEFGNALKNEIRLDQDAMSLTEAVKFQKDIEQIAKEAKRTVDEQEAVNEGFAASANVVRDDIFNQLKAAGVYSDSVSEHYSDFVRDFVVVNAAEMGITPEEFYQRYPYRIVSDRQAATGKESGGLNQFAGPNAVTANAKSLAEAQSRIDAGENAETVRKESGWFKGVDNKWRFEINDADARLINMREDEENGSRATNLADILDHPALFAAYPGLRSMDVVISFGHGLRERGMFEEGYPGDDQTDGRSPQITVEAQTKGEALSTLLRAIQHGISHSRQGLSEAERQESPPSQTADTADSDVIVSFNGVDMANAPKPANAQPYTNATTLTESDILHLMGKAMGSETLAKVLLDSGLVTVVRGDLVIRAAGADGLKSRTELSSARFFSQLSRAFDKAPDKVFGKAGQVKMWLASNKSKLGIKDDEIQWTGINEWLDAMAGQKVSKADVLAYLDQNGVQVQEVEKGASQGVRWQRNSAYSASGEYLGTLEDAGDSYGFVFADDSYFDTGAARMDQALSAVEARIGKSEPEAEKTKYNSYTLPGGENYRELLLTLPVGNKLTVKETKSGYWFIEKPDGRTVGKGYDTEGEAREALQYYVEKGTGADTYRSSHWDEDNILAHVRFNDRIDAYGNKVLFIEELQSDWGQDGKKKGFARKPDAARVQEITARLRQLAKADMENDPEWDVLTKEKEALTRPGVPAAPFVTKTEGWLDLGIKRMIAYAVENGYDKIAFVNGEQSAERYNLSKQVRQISSTKLEGDRFAIRAEGKDGRVALDNIYPANELEDVVGKELAQRIVAETPDTIPAGRAFGKSFSGLDLKVGGEGMKTFYDQIVPQRIRKVTEKIGGGKLEAVRIGETDQVGFSITDQMRQNVIGGLPLFSKDGQIQGVTLPDGRIILNLDALTADNFAGVFKHEGFHSTVKNLLGEAKYNKLMKKLDGQMKQAKGNAWLDQARAAVPSDTKPEHVAEEIGAYAIEQVENGANVPGFIQRWVGEFLSAIRTAIIRFAKADSKLQGWAMQNLKPEDMARLAVAGLRAKALGAMQGQQQMREAVAYSKTPMPDTIDVDGARSDPDLGDYRGQHQASGPDGGAPGHDLTGGGEIFPSDVYGPNGLRYYGQGFESDAEAMGVIQSMRGNPDAEVTIYRAVPNDASITSINPGDWVAITRDYATGHGEGPLQGDYKILEKIVTAKEIFTSGDSLQEWGYWPEETFQQGTGNSWQDGLVDWEQRETAPVGAWVKADYKLDSGQPVYQVRELRMDDLYLPELDEDGRLQPEKRSSLLDYTARAQAGEQPPTIDVIEMEDGRLRVVDGHRRVMAARAAGIGTIRALVSPLVNTPDGKKEATAENITFGLDTGNILRQTSRGTFDPTTLTTLLYAKTTNGKQKSNYSTFLHETGHFFLTVTADLASQPNATERMKRDMQTLLDWFGVKDLETWNAMTLDEQRKYHEQFAYNFEIYLFEGRSPSIEMEGLFRRFSAFLRRTYRSIRDELNIAYREENGTDLPILTGEVRQVMDRMLASEDQIAEAEQIRNMQPIYQTQEQSGMDDATWAEYQQLTRDAREAAVEELMRNSLREMKWLSNARSAIIKRIQKLASAARRQVLQDVSKEVAAEPVYRAISFLRKGMLDGKKHSYPNKLSIYELEAMYDGSPILGLIKKTLGYGKYGMLGKENAIHPEQAAEMFGFSSADEMIREILSAKPLAERVSELTDQRMLEENGNLTDPQAIESAVNEALHNEARARFVAVELRFLSKATSPYRVLNEAAKQAAESILAKKRVRDIRPRDHVVAEARAAKSALQAMKENKPNEAIKHKHAQLVQNHLARLAAEKLRAIESSRKYLAKIDKQFSKMDADYVDQIIALLDGYDLRSSPSLKSIDKRRSLTEWYERQKAQGNDPVIPKKILDEAYQTSYKNLTLQEFNDLVTTIKTIAHLGKLKNQLLVSHDKREFNAIAEDVSERIRKTGGKERALEIEPSRIKQTFESIHAAHRRIESLFRQFDGGDDGPMFRALGRSLTECGTKEAMMNEKATMRLIEIFTPILKLHGGISGDKRFIPALGLSMTRGNRLALALNMGNETNRKRVRDGYNWTDQQIDAVLKTLSREEWVAVQEIWDFLDEFWPDIRDKMRRLYGVAAEKVVAQPFSVFLEDGSRIDLRGGYYPIKYDSLLSDRADNLDAAQKAEDSMRGAFVRNITRHGHEEQRLEDVKRPVKLSLDVITQHIREVAHDLAFHEWLIDANKLISDKRVNAAIRAHYSPATVRMIKRTLTDIAAGELRNTSIIDNVLMQARANVTSAMMLWSMTTALMQPFGITSSIVRLGGLKEGGKWIIVGAMRWLGDTARMESTIGWVYSKSDLMRLRGKTFNRNMYEIMGQVVLGKSKSRMVFDQAGFFFIQRMQTVADIPTWVGAYEKAMSEVTDEARAIALADQAVVDSQGAGQIHNMSQAQRDHPMLGMFYSYYNAVYQLLTESVASTNFKNPVAVAGFISDVVLLITIPAIGPELLLSLLRGDNYEDDDMVDWAKRLAGWQLGYMMNMVIGLREFSGLVTGFDYTGPPASRVVVEAGNVAKQIDQGEIDEAAILSAIRLIGVTYGLPSTQLIRSWRGWNSWQNEEAPASSILVGPPQRD